MKKGVLISFLLLITIYLFSVDVTFRVNMSYQIELGNFDPETDIVDLAGNFNDWQGSGAMQDIGDGMYQTIVTDLETGYVCEFKFRINATWDSAEFPGGANRTYTVVEGENIVEVWYNDQQAPQDEPAHITFIVNDSVDQTHSTFYLKGSWDENGVYDPAWGGGAEHAQFVDDGTNGDQIAGDHIFTAVVDLYPDNGAHTWEWGINDEAHNWLDGNWQFTVVDTSSQTLTYTVPTMTTQDVTVTFSVNMSLVETIADTVSIAGDFNDWTVGQDIMEDNGNQVYTISILFPAGSERYHEFKFVNGQEWEFINNRSFVIDDSAPTQVLDTYYFNDVSPDDFTQQEVTVSFSVNMTQVETIADTISLSGDFNYWTIGTIIMSDDDMDGIYTADVIFPSGSPKHQEYKFVNGQEFESINNRVLEIDDSSSEMILDTVYFNDQQNSTSDSQLVPTSATITLFPNPFIQSQSKNTQLCFSVTINQTKDVKIKIYNLKGEKVDEINAGLKDTGTHKIYWQPNKISSGIYLYRFDKTTNKFTLIK